MFFKRTLIAVILLVTFCSIVFGASVYKSQRYTLTNPRITSGGGNSGKSEHYTITDVQIGNIAGGKGKSEHYTIEAFPIKKRLPRPKPPTVDPVTTPTNSPTQTLSGAKDKNTSICINGYEVIPISTDTTWNIASYNMGEENGLKTLSVTSKNKYNLESPSVIVHITLDTIAPAVTITSPINGAVIDNTPITVTGTIDEPCDVLVNGVLATVTGNAFTAEGVDLRRGENTITANAYDMAGNTSEDSITVTSTTTSDYEITKLMQDAYEYDPTTIVAGSQIPLTVKLEIDGSPASNEPVQFKIIQGSGTIVQPVVNTNANGEATATLTTDTSASITNLIEVFAQNFPSKKVTFHIDTKEGPVAQLVKLTDENIHPVPGAEMDLIVRLEDSNANPIPDNQITYQITGGPGTLSSGSANTNEYGNAKVKLTTTTSPNTLCAVQAQSASNPSLIAVFNITTSGTAPFTADDVIARVIANDQLIHDVTADITVTSNAPWAPPVTQLKIWQKGDKQKVQEISPEPGIYIRPPADTGTLINMTRTIMSYDPATDIYAIKSIQGGQTEEYPYQIDYIDYGKGVITKSEQHIKDGDYIGLFITEYTNLVNTGGIWGFQTMTETAYDEANNQLYTTTNSYSNIQLNTEIPDSEFE